LSDVLPDSLRELSAVTPLGVANDVRVALKRDLFQSVAEAAALPVENI
jgi:hypothetical protein